MLKPQQAAPSSSKLLTLNALVSYEWQLSLGDTALTREEFEAIAALKMPLVQIRGQWVQLDTEQVEAAMRFWERQQQSGEMSLLQAAQLALDEQSSSEGLPLDEVVTEGWVTEWLDRLPARTGFPFCHSLPICRAICDHTRCRAFLVGIFPPLGAGCHPGG